MIDDTSAAPADGATAPELHSAHGDEHDNPVGPVTLPGRVRGGLRAMALAGFVASGLLGAAVIAPPITTISSAIY